MFQEQDGATIYFILILVIALTLGIFVYGVIINRMEKRRERNQQRAKARG